MEQKEKSTFKIFGLSLEDIETAFKLIKKHGPIPILAFWLLVDNGRINRLESNLYDCYKQGYKSADFIPGAIPSSDKNTLLAVLPNKQKLIEADYD